MAAYVSVLVVLTIPGVLVAYLLRMPFQTLLTWPAVPIFSLASVFVLGELTTLAGVPFGAPAFVLLILALSGAAFLAKRRRPSPPREMLNGASRSSARRGRDETLAYGLLVVGGLISAFIWWRGLRDVPLVLPGGDGARHAFLVGRILHEQSTDVSKVLVLDADGVHQVVNYFPLGGHASAAIAASLMRAEVGQVLVALTVVFAAFVLPAGMFVLARFLAPQWPLVAGFTALAVPGLTLFPYATIADGKAFALVGMAMVPVSVVLVTRAVLISRLPRRSPAQIVLVHAPAALALVAVMSTHSSELALVAFLVLLVVLERAWLERHLRLLLHALIRSLTVGLLALVLFAPALGTLLAGASERRSTRALSVPPGTDWTDLLGPVVLLRTYLPPGGFAAALPAVPSVRQFLLAALAFVGAGIWLWYRRAAWVVGWMTVIVLTLFASTTDNPLIRVFTFPWYSGSTRINWNQAFFVPLFAALPLAFAVPVIARVLRRPSAIVGGTLVVVALFTAFVGFPGYRTSWSFLHSAFAVKPTTYGNQARVDASSEAAFEWLDAHGERNDTVINEPQIDGSLWMYAQRGVKPLMAWDPPISFASESTAMDWRNRRYLIQHVHELGNDPSVEPLVRRYRARWIYVDDRTFPTGRHELKVDELRSNPHISEVFRRSTVHVFRIDAV